MYLKHIGYPESLKYKSERNKENHKKSFRCLIQVGAQLIETFMVSKRINKKTQKKERKERVETKERRDRKQLSYHVKVGASFLTADLLSRRNDKKIKEGEMHLSKSYDGVD